MHTNHLINETSTYLLQHAHNPVNWFAWNDEALQKAKEENKPILVSIGYAACHWCHVMERESFEDEATAELMNAYFINIKIDREERPDIDHIYMDAVQAMTGSGGWPLNVFLTPERKPFYGGTYFPPKPAHGRVSWKELLHSVHNAWKNRKHEIESQAENLTAHLAKANDIGNKNVAGESFFTKENLEIIAENILKNADAVWGGFGNAPKFPQTFCIRFLLRHYYFTGNENAARQALLSLDKMMQGGIYDQLGGGFSRYSTDREWLAPHFEKMLYDNALLITSLSEAYQLTKEKKYADCIYETIDFVEREMLSKDEGFYSAIDADSEGTEGKFYVWSKNEVDEILKEDAAIFCKVYDVSEEGNWEHKNIFRLLRSINEISLEEKIPEKFLLERIKIAKQKLFIEREKRSRPLTDDKILLSGNALMITALCKAFGALSDGRFLALAEKNILFLQENFKDKNSPAWFHTWKNNIAKYPAFLDDYAFLIEAYINLQEVTGNEIYLLKAKEIAEFVIEYFKDESSAFFSFTNVSDKNILLQKKEIYDGATPSGNAVMATNLFYLSIIFDKKEWKEISEKMLEALGKNLLLYPSSFGVWLMLLANSVYTINEVVISGENFLKNLALFNMNFIPNRVVQSSKKSINHFPLLSGKVNKNGESTFYLCFNYECMKPVYNIEDLLRLIKNK